MKPDAVKQTARARAGGQALGELQKAIRFFRLYPHEHPFCTQAIDSSVEHIARFLEKHGPLDVEIRREGCFIEDGLALNDSGQSTDLTALLYPEGIRALTLEAGLQRQEIFDFVAILSAHYSEKEDEVTFGTDLMTAIWRRDFANIEYKIVDQLSPTAVRGNLVGDIAVLAKRIVELADDLGQGREQAQELEVEKFLSELDAAKEKGQLDDMANWSSIPEPPRGFKETPTGQARLALARELEDPFLNDLVGRTADIVVWASARTDERRTDDGQPPTDRPDTEDVGRFLAGSTLNALQQNDVGRATDLLLRVQAADAATNLLAPAVSKRLATPESLQLLAAALEAESQKIDRDRLAERGARFLSALDRSCVASLCSIYPSLAKPEVRHAFLTFLETRAADDVESIATLARSDKSETVADALRMLAKGGRGSKGFALIEAIAKDAKHPAHASAQDLVDELSGARQRRELVKVVDAGATKSDRMDAARTLAETGDGRFFDELSAVVQSSRFAQRDRDEVDAVMAALVKIGKLRSVRVLQELAQKKSTMRFWSGARAITEIAQAHLDALKKR